MRGFVLNLKRRRRIGIETFNFKFSDLLRGIRRNSVAVFFTFVFASGMLMGSLSAKGADESMLTKLDFLFTTNLSSRLEQTFFSTFSASFASNFIFLFFVFLCGLAPWGMIVVFIAPIFKGFGTGLSAGYLFITYGFKGVGFYLLIVLGGTFLFSFTLVIECIQAQLLSLRIARSVFASKDAEAPLSCFVRTYLFRSLYALLLTTASALLDMILWTSFSGMFF